MTRALIIASDIAFRALAQTTLASSSENHQTPWGLFALVVVGLILFVAFTGLLALLAHRASTKATQAHSRRGPFVLSDPDAAATDSIRQAPTR